MPTRLVIPILALLKTSSGMTVECASMVDDKIIFGAEFIAFTVLAGGINRIGIEDSSFHKVETGGSARARLRRSNDLQPLSFESRPMNVSGVTGWEKGIGSSSGCEPPGSICGSCMLL